MSGRSLSSLRGRGLHPIVTRADGTSCPTATCLCAAASLSGDVPSVKRARRDRSGRVDRDGAVAHCSGAERGEGSPRETWYFVFLNGLFFFPALAITQGHSPCLRHTGLCNGDAFAGNMGTSSTAGAVCACYFRSLFEPITSKANWAP